MNSEDWYLDTGATSHFCSSKDIMNDFVPNNANCVKIADGTMLQSASVGKIPILLKTKNTMNAKDVLYVPDLSINLLAVSKFAQFGRSVIFDQHGCKIVDRVMKVPQKSILGTEVNGLYVLDVEKTTSYFKNTSSNGNIWHRILGHLNRYSLDQLVKGMAIGV